MYISQTNGSTCLQMSFPPPPRARNTQCNPADRFSGSLSDITSVIEETTTRTRSSADNKRDAQRSILMTTYHIYIYIYI